MRISELLEIDFAKPGVGDYLDIESEDTCVEGMIADVTEDGYIVDVSESALEYLSSIAQLEEAEYHGHAVKLGKPMQGDVKKFKVYVRNPKTGKVVKVNFGDKTMRIHKSNPARRRSFRARHNCASPGPRTKARYWSCRKW
jgi:hypothetical protein